MSTPTSFLKRVVGGLKHRTLRLFRPMLIPLRDWQAPRLHRYMMHVAGVATQPNLKTALVIAPHHDDETFGCGGVIALKRQAGVDVDVVILTDGRQSHGQGVDLDQLALTRQAEAIKATAALGVPPQRVHFFDLPDQGLRHLEPPRRSAAVDRLAQMITQLVPGEIYINHRTDRHPDHEAAYALTADAVRQSKTAATVLQYPIWLIWKGPARATLKPFDLANALRIDVHSVQPIKDQAIQIYLSQLPVLPAGFVQQFEQGFEIFFTSPM